MRKHLAWAVPAAASLSLTLPLQPCRAADGASIDLAVTGPQKVIIGTPVTIDATVRNAAITGSNDLNYRIDWSLPGGTQYSVANNPLAPGDSYTWNAAFDTIATGHGPQTTTVTVTDPAAENSPVTENWTTNVVDHAVPLEFRTVNGVTKPRPAAQEPPVDPLAFGATGGGETFAAQSGVFNDPAVPTAGLDLDQIVESGDVEKMRAVFRPAGCLPSSPDQPADNCGYQDMNSFIASFKNLTEIHEASGQYGTTFDDPDNPAPPDLYMQYGRWFDVFVDTSEAGDFTKTWTFYFSDADNVLGGNEADPLNKIDITYTVHVYAAPVPASAWLFGSGLVGLLGFWRRGRARSNP